MKLLLGSAVAMLTSAVGAAHIGSPDAWYDGPAGPYHVLVHVQAPPVVPGIAVVNVKVVDQDIDSVTAFVNKFDATGGVPPPDVAQPVKETPEWYRARLWVMTPGSNGVTVAVYGNHGSGSVVVPLSAVAGRRLDFNAPLAALLIAVGVFLALGLFTIVGAAVRESVLPPGEEADSRRRRRARRAIGRAAVVVALAITGLGLWWRAADADFARQLYRPLAVKAVVDSVSPQRTLTLSIDDSSWTQRGNPAWLRARGRTQITSLVEDHGKLMHLFVVATDGRSAFAHLHPSTADTIAFKSPLPPLPQGSYRLFADIVHESGFVQTLTTTVELPKPATVNPKRVDSDDSWALGKRDSATASIVLEDGTTLHWQRGDNEPLVAGAEANLRFRVVLPARDSASLQPYLGMPGHAVVVRDDARVFIHLHPLGTISMAAQARLAQSSPAIRVSHTMSSAQVSQSALYFPYAFPEAGTYTVWIQVKRRGRVLTGSFPVHVSAATP